MSYQEQTTPLQGTGPIDTKLSTTNILERAKTEGDLSEFVEAAREAGLENVLQGAELITVFAPKNGSFERALTHHRDDRREMLVRQIIRGSITLAELKSGNTNSLKTLEGVAVAVDVGRETIRYNGGEVTKGDIPCTNGVLHIVDVFETR